jgi:hypothetical protein
MSSKDQATYGEIRDDVAPREEVSRDFRTFGSGLAATDNYPSLPSSVLMPIFNSAILSS